MSATTSTIDRVDSVFLGKIARFNNVVDSAYVKQQAESDSVTVTSLGFEGDEHGHPGHGGVDRAVNHYPKSNYTELLRLVGDDVAANIKSTMVPGGFGENISSSGGMNEDTVCIGDVYRVGTTVLEVSQPRYPCPKVNMHHKCKVLTQAALTNGMSGWFYRVLEEGTLKAGDEFILERRPNPGFTVRRLQTSLFGVGNARVNERTPEGAAFLRSVVAMDVLAWLKWKETAAARLDALPRENHVVGWSLVGVALLLAVVVLQRR